MVGLKVIAKSTRFRGYFDADLLKIFAELIYFYR
jgi:hypothetical protein